MRHFKDVLDDLCDNELDISQLVADNPARSRLKCCKNHSSWFPCEYCFAKGIKIEIIENSTARKKILGQKKIVEEKIAECQAEPCTTDRETKINNLIALKEELQKSLSALKKKSNILWPSSTMGAKNRSRQEILDIVTKIENNEQLSLEESKGIVGRSPLLDFPNFNFVYDAPAEYLHSSCLGVIKRLVELTFDVGDKRKRLTKRKLSSTVLFNKLMLTIKVFKEFSRRARKLDFAVFKGQEFRNLALFFSHSFWIALKLKQKRGIFGSI